MKFTIRDYSIKVISVINGSYIDLAKKLLQIHNEHNEKNHLALSVENSMENTASDNDIKIETLAWKNYVDSCADNVLNCNAPFVYVDSDQINMSEYPTEMYLYIDDVATMECEEHFGKSDDEKLDIKKLLNDQVNDLQRQLDEIKEKRNILNEQENMIHESLSKVDNAIDTINLLIN